MKKYIYLALMIIITLMPIPSFTTIAILTSEQDYLSLINQKMVLVDFYADWCGPCKTLARTLHAVQEKYPNLTIVKVDIEKYPNLAEQYRLRALPALYFFSYGKQLSVTDPQNNQLLPHIIGLRSQKDLETIIKTTYYSPS